jgi:hypothetical protein
MTCEYSFERSRFVLLGPTVKEMLPLDCASLCPYARAKRQAPAITGTLVLRARPLAEGGALPSGRHNRHRRRTKVQEGRQCVQPPSFPWACLGLTGPAWDAISTGPGSAW